MVKKNDIMGKTLWKSIRSSLGRYIAIVLIIALGSAMFVGLRLTKTDMVATGQRLMDELNMFDLRLISTYGWSEDSLTEIRKLDGVLQAEGVQTLDAIVTRDGSSQEAVYKFYNIPEEINQISLQLGRMPQAPDECLIDGYHAGKSSLGKTIRIAESNPESVTDSLKYHEFVIVGAVKTPIYMNMERGNTSLLNGQVSSFLYVPTEAFDMDYYTEIDITTSGSKIVYSEAYRDTVEKLADTLEPLLKPIAQVRADEVKADAEEQYADGLQEYEDGLKEFEDAKKDTYEQLGEAKKKLEDGQKEIDENRILLEDGKKQLEDGKKTIQESYDTLADSSNTLAQAKVSAYAELSKANTELLSQYKVAVENLRQVENGLTQINDGLTKINTYVTTLNLTVIAGETALDQADTMLSVMDTGITAAEAALEYAKDNTLTDEETIASLQSRLNDLRARREEAILSKQDAEAQVAEARRNLEELQAQQEELEAQKAELVAAKETLDSAMDQLDVAFKELQSGQTAADNQFAAGEAQIQAGKMKLDAASRELEQQEKELLKGMEELEAGQEEIDQGWIDFQEGMREADEEIAKAQQELLDAKEKLDDARDQLDNFKEPTIFLLDRDSNTGYQALDSNSDIVYSVAKVFPVFFLLIAAMVCITTMTRMISEERTQIGTMKALGYTNWEIMRKYMFYSGSAALLGCSLGVLSGSVIFPQCLWKAYSIMFNIADWVVMKLDIPLCSTVVIVYTIVNLLVTWYCCNQELKEVPAELMRPLAPTSGKKIFLEYLPFWKNISFLNKVMLRNIFRYRQRLFMMMLGIGGCMALLMTGFGIRDSIVGFVDQQFRDITTYDVAVYFGSNQDEEKQTDFRSEYHSEIESMIFFNQQSVTMDCEKGSKDIYLIAADPHLTDFMNLINHNRTVDMPNVNEVLISIGAAEAMNVKIGDTITTRDSDMNSMTLTISGIFENHVYNYLIVIPETVEEQLGSAPEQIAAYLKFREGASDSYTLAKLNDNSSIINVVSSKSLAGSVNNMMTAMNMVIWIVVICAGLLGAIVLYNLTNININERLREIATIKVLGFNSLETATYVFKENLVLSAFGGLFGILLGRYLLIFVMSQIKIDMVWFSTVITLNTVILSFLLTMLTAFLVDLVFYPRLDRINMAEALKSVE